MKNSLTFLVLFSGILSLLPTHSRAQWVQTNGPCDESVSCFAVSRMNLFAGTDYRGFSDCGAVFLSADNGTSWTAVDSGLTAPDIRALVVRPNGGGGTNLFAGTGGNGVFRSTDDGTSWRAVDSGLGSTAIYSLVVSGANLFAGTDNGVFLSTDNGTSWTAVNNGFPGNIYGTTRYSSVTSFAVSDTNLFAAPEYGGVFLSTDNGSSWTAVNNGLTNPYVYAFAVSGTNLFVGTRGGVFLSTNSGRSWTAVNTDLPITDVPALAVSGTNLFAGLARLGVWLSTNSGTSWTWVDSGLTNPYVRSLAVGSPDSSGLGNLFAGTAYGGVWKRPLSEMITAVKGSPSGELPKNFALEQNYPNPFNPTTTINYDIPQVSRVRLSIFNVLGQEVARLVDKEQNAGKYSVTFSAEGGSASGGDAAKLPGGVYFYRLLVRPISGGQTGLFAETKKLILLK